MRRAFWVNVKPMPQGLLLDRLDAIEVHNYQFVVRQQRLDSCPYPGKKSVKLAAAHVPEAKMHHPRRWRVEHDSNREVSVFRHDHQLLQPGDLPDLSITHASTEFSHMGEGERRLEALLPGHILIKDEALQATLCSEN